MHGLRLPASSYDGFRVRQAIAPEGIPDARGAREPYAALFERMSAIVEPLRSDPSSARAFGAATFSHKGRRTS